MYSITTAGGNDRKHLNLGSSENCFLHASSKACLLKFRESTQTSNKNIYSLLKRLMATMLEFTSIQNLSDLQFTQNSIRKASHGAFCSAVDPNASKIK